MYSYMRGEVNSSPSAMSATVRMMNTDAIGSQLAASACGPPAM